MPTATRVSPQFQIEPPIPVTSDYEAGVGGILEGHAVYISAADTALPAIATSAAQGRAVVGVATADIPAASTGAVAVSGPVVALFENGLFPLPSPGQRVFLSALVAGRMTNDAPLVLNGVALPLGTIKEVSDYLSDDTVTIDFSIGPTVRIILLP